MAFTAVELISEQIMLREGKRRKLCVLISGGQFHHGYFVVSYRFEHRSTAAQQENPSSSSHILAGED